MKVKKQQKKATVRPSVQSVAADLSQHEAQCAERWRTIFNETNELKQEVKSINLQLKAGLGILVVGMGSILSAQLF